MNDKRLLIVGASVRAAAFSARRSGFDPECADLFADADLSVGLYFPTIVTRLGIGRTDFGCAECRK